MILSSCSEVVMVRICLHPVRCLSLWEKTVLKWVQTALWFGFDSTRQRDINHLLLFECSDDCSVPSNQDVLEPLLWIQDKV
jgi:hypothetical protein